jgi:hypothetical protein
VFSVLVELRCKDRANALIANSSPSYMMSSAAVVTKMHSAPPENRPLESLEALYAVFHERLGDLTTCSATRIEGLL